MIKTNTPPNTQTKSTRLTKIGTYQTHGLSFKGKQYQRFDHDSLNNYQNFLYHRALFGLSIYTQQEIVSMHKEKRKRIVKIHKTTQRFLNLWKQEILIDKTNKLFEKLFPKNPIAKKILDESCPEPTFKCNLSFESLGITKQQIVEKLLSEKILPKDFHNLKQAICK